MIGTNSTIHKPRSFLRIATALVSLLFVVSVLHVPAENSAFAATSYSATVVGSGNVSSVTSIPIGDLTDTGNLLLVVLTSNQVQNYSFSSGVTATQVATAGGRSTVFAVQLSSPVVTGVVVTASTSAVQSWAIVDVAGADDTTPIYSSIANIGSTTSSTMTGSIVDLGYITTGSEYALSINGVNASADWTTDSNTLFATAGTTNAGIMISGYEIAANQIVYAAPSVDRGYSGTTRIETNITLAFPGESGVPNLAQNGSFEGTAAVASGWSTESTVTGTATWSSGAVGVNDGLKSQAVSYTGQLGDDDTKMFTIYQTPIATSPGQIYEFSVCASGSKANSTMLVGIEDFETDGTFISENNITVGSLTSTPTCYTVQHTTAPGADHITIYVQFNEIGSATTVQAYLDKAILKLIGQSGPDTPRPADPDNPNNMQLLPPNTGLRFQPAIL